MIEFVAFLFVALTVLIEIRSAQLTSRQLFFRGTPSTTLIEPGEEVVLESRLYNAGPLPVLYITQMEALPTTARILEEEDWKKSHLSKGSLGLSTKYRVYLLTNRQFNSRIRFTVDKRGMYSYGKYYLETGDFLGLRTKVRTGDADKQLIVMPNKTDSYVSWKAYSGFIGDISVSRFIMEDPVLTIGYREYTGREPMKSISWSQTARTGQLMVKQYDHTSEINVTIILNFENGEEEDMEKCFEVVRTICEDLETKKISYTFLNNGDMLRKLPTGLGYNHFCRIMRELGKSRCKCLGSLERLVDKCLEDRSGSRGYIVVTPPLTDKTRKAIKKLQLGIDQKLCVLEVKQYED